MEEHGLREKKFTILVVDDEPSHLVDAAEFLGDMFNVVTADNAERGIEVAGRIDVDLAMVDYHMPPGANGIQFLMKLSQIAPRCMRFLVTGHSERSMLQEAINTVSVYRFVAKGVEWNTIIEDVRLALQHRTDQEARAKAERLAVAGQTACVAAHDMNNVAQLCLFISSCLTRGEVDEARRLAAKVEQDIQAYSREIMAISRGVVPKYNLTLGALEEVVRNSARYVKGRTLTTDIGSALPLVSISKHHCERMLTNLLRNAAQATPSDGAIAVHVFAENTEWVVVTVTDNGPGIPRAVQERMFEAFNSTKGDGGTGFGLKMAKDVMDAHKGTITYSTAEGRGTTFTMRFPIP